MSKPVFVGGVRYQPAAQYKAGVVLLRSEAGAWVVFVPRPLRAARKQAYIPFGVDEERARRFCKGEAVYR